MNDASKCSTPSSDVVAVPLTTRGSTECRGCSGTDLQSVLDLGLQPLANELLPTPTAPEARFPLHLRICLECGLGQVGEYVLPERIFGDYPYLSSMSSTWIDHARKFALDQQRELALGKDSWVLEIASNDGYLLREFMTLGVEVLGVEPASNVAKIANGAGVSTLNTFFSKEVALRLRDSRRAPRLIVANNVMAHVPDLSDFLTGMASVADETTVIAVENPTFTNMLVGGQFDSIYHEHFSYLSAHAVAVMARLSGLVLFNVEALPTHGGSNRYWIAKAGTRKIRPAVNIAIERELTSGLLNSTAHQRFAEAAWNSVLALQEWLVSRNSTFNPVVAYGAAAKGNTLLNAAGIAAPSIRAVVDASPEKQGKFLPGSRIPILSPDSLSGLAPHTVLILPWNIKDEVAPFVKSVAPKAEVWIAVPHLERV